MLASRHRHSFSVDSILSIGCLYVGCLLVSGCGTSSAPGPSDSGSTDSGATNSSLMESVDTSGSSPDSMGSDESSSISQTVAGKQASGGESSEEGAHSVASPDSSTISVASLEVDALAEKVATHIGHVVLIDYWATWCGPCLQEFPHTIQRSHQYRDAGLRVITVSCDAPDDGEKVLGTLRKLGAELENYHTSVDMQETFDAFDIRGGIPFYQLYDRQGVLRYRFNGAPAAGDDAEPTDQIDIRIRELLDEMPE